MIKEIIDLRLKRHQSSNKFPISSINSCWRKKYLIIKEEYKEEYDAKTLRAFEIGNIFHNQAVKEIFEKGDAFGLRVVSSEINIPEQKYISGRTDLILSNDKTNELYICDIKSCTDWTLNKIRKGECPQNYINQIQLYLHFFGIKRGFLLFFGKHRGETEEVEVVYDEELCLKLIQEIEDFFKEYVEKDIEPPRCDGGSFGCDCCGIKPKEVKK